MIFTVLLRPAPGLDSTSPAQERSNTTTKSMTDTLGEPGDARLLHQHLVALEPDTCLTLCMNDPVRSVYVAP